MSSVTSLPSENLDAYDFLVEFLSVLGRTNFFFTILGIGASAYLFIIVSKRTNKGVF